LIVDYRWRHVARVAVIGATGGRCAIKDSIKPSTHVNYADYRDAYVVPNIGKRRLQDIDVPMLNALYRHLLSAGRCKRDTNTVMFEYWSTRRASGVEPKPKEIAEHCKVTIYAARHAVLRYRRGRIPVAKTAGLAPKTVKNVHRMLHRALSDAVGAPTSGAFSDSASRRPQARTAPPLSTRPSRQEMPTYTPHKRRRHP
jgi:hypothetical protein